MKGFYVPDFPEIGYLKKLGSAQGMDENFRKGFLEAHLDDGEIIYSSKAYGSRNSRLMFQNGDLGWVFVTDKRILFWSDNSRKPHIAIDYKSIVSCKIGYAIMRQKSVKIEVDGETIKFGIHKYAAELIKKLVKSGGFSS
jgi:Bacterial PH domain